MYGSMSTSKTFPQQAAAICNNGYIVIKNRPCKVSLVTETGHAKNDVRSPTHENLLAEKIHHRFDEGKDLVVTIISAMGEEQICALKEIGPQ